MSLRKESSISKRVCMPMSCRVGTSHPSFFPFLDRGQASACHHRTGTAGQSLSSARRLVCPPQQKARSSRANRFRVHRIVGQHQSGHAHTTLSMSSMRNFLAYRMTMTSFPFIRQPASRSPISAIPLRPVWPCGRSKSSVYRSPRDQRSHPGRSGQLIGLPPHFFGAAVALILDPFHRRLCAGWRTQKVPRILLESMHVKMPQSFVVNRESHTGPQPWMESREIEGFQKRSRGLRSPKRMGLTRTMADFRRRKLAQVNRNADRQVAIDGIARQT
ncbi:hypothetical protein Sinac_6179 [Singulisphaera acidiphila DSM 18658]|uniref:Uncharacterized protein n=1 Tax=Singulisphaera acidiphila (strain ATCC BAA-1392 / DSM 18658 / VKM B-2454 / MOB10) TaxID=886293 RepID=L0DN61_SINAD|nr:hypothetical protein Sinac_6179 [Singulisphaera acidiphila DSM 18658]